VKQLSQDSKDGSIQVIEVPAPLMERGHVLVRNHFSVISAGTEKTTVREIQKTMLEKMKERPGKVLKVIDRVTEKGFYATYESIMKKPHVYTPLGYSCSGEVIQAASDADGFDVGDLVACAGLKASHAEIVSVPVNLCVKLKPEANLNNAAYNTLGAIALQGVRQADLRLSETCAVIGLGLLGQLTGLLLKASGVRVIGVDTNPAAIELSSGYSTDLALQRDSLGLEDRIRVFSKGLGCDAVIITAATDSLDPINFAGAIARKKGTIVVVGAIPTGFDRDPHYYKKELHLKMSCSYGPGRYDPAYETKGIDYPAAYVRWTEKRNMEAFQEMVHSKQIDVTRLTTHVFKFDEAPKAYDLILKDAEPYLGVVLQYNVEAPLKFQQTRLFAQVSAVAERPASVSIGFIGAGLYARDYLLPHISKNSDVALVGVMNSAGASAKTVGDAYGFEFCTSDEKDLFENPKINTMFIASRHDSHATYVEQALRACKNVFVEKPLCLKDEELDVIVETLQRSNNSGSAADCRPLLMVGYNRRFSPHARIIKETFNDGAMAIVYRINAGAIPSDHWVQDRDLGGGRIMGEVCHFIDFLTFINGSLPNTVYAKALESYDHNKDTLVISIGFQNGSVGCICYFSNGDKTVPKERIEIFSHEGTAILDDYKALTIHYKSHRNEIKLKRQDKGQKEEMRLFIDSVRQRKKELIPLEEIISTSRVTFRIMDSIRSGAAVRL
jgi:predicted dehydrogenase/threonine dehydrogenase-like Zn-dependent dehydrogenase